MQLQNNVICIDSVKGMKKLSDNSMALERFNRESLIVARLSHPHIIHVIDRGVTSNGMPFFVMEYVVYVLYSEKFEMHYTGCTTSLISRFHSHNHFSKKGFTIKYRPWKVIHVEFFNSKSDALKREKYLKTGKGRDFIKNIVY